MYRSVTVVEDGRSSVSRYSIDQLFLSKGCRRCSGCGAPRVSSEWILDDMGLVSDADVPEVKLVIEVPSSRSSVNRWVDRMQT